MKTKRVARWFTTYSIPLNGEWVTYTASFRSHEAAKSSADQLNASINAGEAYGPAEVTGPHYILVPLKDPAKPNRGLLGILTRGNGTSFYLSRSRK